MTLMCTLKTLKRFRKRGYPDYKTLFRKRGYPDYLIKENIEKALRLTPSDENNSKKVNGVSLVVTYNPAFKNLFQVIRKNLQLLHEEVKKVFTCPICFLQET